MASSQAQQFENIERRASRRYPVNVDVEYRIMPAAENGSVCYGRTVNLSTTGLMLECIPALQMGLDIELTIKWPVRRGEGTGIELHAFGRTIRVEEGYTALRISDSFQFDL